MRKNLFPWVFQSRRALCSMPDQKRQSLGQWADVDYVEDNSSFPRGCGFQSSNALVWVPYPYVEKKLRTGASWGDEWNGFPLFSVLIYLLLFIMTLLLKLFCKTKSRVGHRSESYKSYKKQHCAKDLGSTSPYTENVFFWRFFLKCILCTFNPVRYCNNTGTFHPPGSREGNRAKKKSGCLKPSV